MTSNGASLNCSISIASPVLTVVYGPIFQPMKAITAMVQSIRNMLLITLEPLLLPLLVIVVLQRYQVQYFMVMNDCFHV